MDYTYLVASLPLLAFDGNLPMSAQEYVRYCESLMAHSDHETLQQVAAGRLDDVDEPAIRVYAARDTQLRNAVARLRAARAGVDVQRFLHEHLGWQIAIENGVAHAMALGDPLERERALDRLRWQLLDEVAGMPAFGAQAVYAYVVRLQMLEKWQRLSEERGAQVANQIIEASVAGISL